MENNGLEETNEASPRAVAKLEGDVFTIQNEDWDKQSGGAKTLNIGHDDSEFGNELDNISDKISSQVVDKLEGDTYSIQNNEDHKESKQVKIQNICHNGPKYDNGQDDLSNKTGFQTIKKLDGDAFTVQNEDHNNDSKEVKVQNFGKYGPRFEKEPDDISNNIYEMIYVNSNTHEEVQDNKTIELELAHWVDEKRDLQYGPREENLKTNSSSIPDELFQKVHESNSTKFESQANIVGKEYFGTDVDNSEYFESKNQKVNLDNNLEHNDLAKDKDDNRSMDSTQVNRKTDNTSNEDNNLEPLFDRVEVLGVDVSQRTSTLTSDADPGTQHVVKKAAALKNFVREKSLVVVSTLLRRLSIKIDEGSMGNLDDKDKDISYSSRNSESKEVYEKIVEKTTWNPLYYIKMPSDADAKNKIDQREEPISEGPLQPIAMKGRIILYTRLGCQESKEVRQFLYIKRLRYVEINIDVYPSRKMELEKNSKSTSVPKVFFNEILIGGLSELKTLNESGKLDEKIDFLINEAPTFEGPVPPLSGEDDVSTSAALDEMALIVRKMKISIVVKDRFSKMRRFTNCFLGSQAVDFLSEDQYLERNEVSLI